MNVKQLIKNWHEQADLIAGYAICCDYDTRNETAVRIELHALTVWWALRSLYAEKVTCRNGHDYIELDGNPETGSFYGECSRCGHSVSGYW